MIKVHHKLEGLYASPKYHPVTCANPAPWKITELRIDNTHIELPFAIYIRGNESMWFRMDQCHIGTHEELKCNQ